MHESKLSTKATLKLMVYASAVDGEIHPSEINRIKQIITCYKQFSNFGPEDIAEVGNEIVNLISSGSPDIAETISSKIDSSDYQTAFAYVLEVCASDYQFNTQEISLIKKLKVLFKLEEQCYLSLKSSIFIRYGLNLKLE